MPIQKNDDCGTGTDLVLVQGSLEVRGSRQTALIEESKSRLMLLLACGILTGGNKSL